MTLTKQRLVIAVVVIAALTGPVGIGSAQAIEEQPSESNASVRSIPGVWRTVVTPYNCQTGQPIVTLSGLFTFHQGGTMSEYGIGPGSTPALRSPGHGLWQREAGWQQYSFVFTFYRYNANGVLLGSQKVRAALELGGTGDYFASRSQIETLDLNDNVIGMGCANTVGTRFE